MIPARAENHKQNDEISEMIRSELGSVQDRAISSGGRDSDFKGKSRKEGRNKWGREGEEGKKKIQNQSSTVGSYQSTPLQLPWELAPDN